MHFCFFLCCVGLRRLKLCHGPMPHPRDPTKYLKGFIVSEVNYKLEGTRWSNRRKLENKKQ